MIRKAIPSWKIAEKRKTENATNPFEKPLRSIGL